MPEPITGVSGADIVNFARAQLGDRYVWGAEGPDVFDCSGLVDYVYRHFGLNTPRTTADMLSGKGGLQSISEGQLQPGDLILSKGWSNRTPGQGHVGIYMGQGKLIEAGDPVQITTFGPTYKAHVTGYRRVPGVTGFGAGGSAADPTGPYTGGLPNPTNPGQVAGFVRSWIPTPGNVTEGLTNLGEAMLGVAKGAAEIGQLAGTVGRLFLPGNMLRAFLMMMGIAFLFVGVWFIASEARDA